MSIHQRIKEHYKSSRIARNTFDTVCLSTFLGDVQKETIKNKTDLASNEFVIALLKKYINNNNETFNHLVAAGNDTDADMCILLTHEANLLESFLPKQFTNDELRSKISTYIETNGPVNMGDIMKWLKTEYAGLYDGKAANLIVRELL